MLVVDPPAVLAAAAAAALSETAAQTAEDNAESAADAAAGSQIAAAGSATSAATSATAATTAETNAETAETAAEAAQVAAEAARDAAVDISNIDTSDGVVEALVLNTGGAGPLTSAALSATFASGQGTIIYASPAGDDANNGLIDSAPKRTLAAALTAIGAGVRGTVYLSAGDIDAGSGVDFTGFPVSVIGKGSEYTTIKTTAAQVGPVLDFTGVGSNNNRVTIGGFAVEGDNTADATNAKKGIAFSRTTSPVAFRLFDIVVRETGGSCYDFGAMELSELDALIAMPPVSAAANDIPWVEAHGAFNGNRFRNCGLLATSLVANVGVNGAMRVYDDGTTAPHDNDYEFYAQSLLVANGGTIFDVRANAGTWNAQFFDCAKDAGATGTSHYRFKPCGGGTDKGGNQIVGVIPGKDGGVGNSLDMGVDFQQSRNRAVGVKGYKGTNVTIASGVANCYVELAGAYALATDAAVVDNSGLANNVWIDHFLRTASFGQFLYDTITTSAQQGPRYRDAATPANGAVYLGNTGARVQAVSTAMYTTADNVIFRSIAQANAFAIATTGSALGVTFFNTTLPAASATYRGRVAMVQGAAGVADRLVICRKDAADAYAWTDLF